MIALETGRLRIRPFTLADAPFILRLLNEPSFLQHIGGKGVRTLEGAEVYLGGGPMASYARHGHGLCLVEAREGGEPMGMCGLLKRDQFRDVDLGYAFVPEFWSKGYAFEAGEAVLAWGKRNLGLVKVLAIVSPDNGPSIRLLLKLGFACTGALRMAPEEPEVALYERQDGPGTTERPHA